MQYPSIIVLFTSYRCNACCIMCSAWQKQKSQKELSVGDISRIFSNRILKKSVQVVNITGGEPTLRDDLVEIIKVLADECVNLKRIDLSTNGINTVEVIDRIEQILAFLMQTEIKLSVSVSVDGISGIHDAIRRTPGAFENTNKTIDELKELMLLYPTFTVGMNCTINKLNYSALEDVLNYSFEKALGINFTLAAISEIGVESIDAREQFELNSEEKEKTALFINSLIDMAHIDKRYGNFLLQWLKNGVRKERCTFKEGKSILCEPDGTVYQCGNFKDFKLGNLFEKPLEHIINSNGNFGKLYRIRCRTCNSNCYINA